MTSLSSGLDTPFCACVCTQRREKREGRKEGSRRDLELTVVLSLTLPLGLSRGCLHQLSISDPDGRADERTEKERKPFSVFLFVKSHDAFFAMEENLNFLETASTV